MKTLLILTIALAALGCRSPVDSGEPSGDIERVNITGADGFALVSNSPAQLVKMENGTPTHVEWETEGGDTVTVPVSNARRLGDDYLMVEYDYEDNRHRQAANRTDGVLSDVPSPDNWDRMRYRRNTAYYVSGGRVVSVDPDTGSSQALTRAEDSIPSRAYLEVPDNGVPFLFSNDFMFGYPDPDTPVDNSGRNSAQRFYSALIGAGNVSEQSTLYDPDTDRFLLLDWGNDNWRETELRTDGSTRESTSEAWATPMDKARRLGSGLPTPSNSLFTDGYAGVFEVELVDGAPTLVQHDTDYAAGQWVEESLYVDGAYYYRTNPSGSGSMQLREHVLGGSERHLIDLADEAEVEWTVAGGSLFWFDSNGDGWRMDLATETVESYEMSSIEAVTE